ncbi:DNA cytosine methyltransferase [soil metagenome]
MTRELITDSFAGGGGASLGIEMALGRSPDIAINHDAEALAMHAANHPSTVHLSKNIWKVDPLDHVHGKRIGLAWFSPDCKHFSKAKGGKPVARNIRDLAWVVVLWAKRVRPRIIMLENVEEFRSWGPLGEDGMPCPVRKGQTFKRWVREIQKLGYRVEHRELRACDYGAPTIRKRLFLIARCDGAPIVWPAPTHGAPDSEEVILGDRLPWRTAAECIDWSLPCHSIFLTRDEGRAAGVNRPLAQATMARIAKGVKRYVIDAAKPFIVNLTHHGGARTEDVDEPFKTVTGAHRGEKAVVVPMLSYGQQGGATRDACAPAHTITASTKDTNQLVTAVLAGCGGRAAQSPPKPLGEPMNTITAKADPILVAAHLTEFRGGHTGRPLDTPMPTITGNGFLKRPGGAPPQAVAIAFLAQHNNDKKRVDGVNPGRRADHPFSTIISSGSHQSVVAAHLINLKGSDRRDGPVDEPAPSVTAGGRHIGEVRAFLMKYYGTDQDPNLEGPLHTVTTKDRFGLVMVEGEPYEIVDIGMRMLSPRELFRAQGFPDSYGIAVPFGGKVLSKTAQIRMCGNSVSPVMARALVSANYTEAVAREAA